MTQSASSSKPNHAHTPLGRTLSGTWMRAAASAAPAAYREEAQRLCRAHLLNVRLSLYGMVLSTLGALLVGISAGAHLAQHLLVTGGLTVTLLAWAGYSQMWQELGRNMVDERGPGLMRSWRPLHATSLIVGLVMTVMLAGDHTPGSAGWTLMLCVGGMITCALTLLDSAISWGVAHWMRAPHDTPQLVQVEDTASP